MSEIQLDILGKIELSSEIRKVGEELLKIEGISKEVADQVGKAFSLQGSPEKKLAEVTVELTEQKKIADQLTQSLKGVFTGDLGAKQQEQIGKINEGLKKSGAESKKTLTDMKSIQAEAKKLLETMSQNTGNIQKQSQAIGEFVSQLEPEQAQAFFAGVNDGLDEFAEKVETPRKRLRELKTLLSQMDESSPEFMNLSIEAAELEDKIGDVNQRIRNLASDTKNLDALISAAQGITGAFAVAQGAIGLFGTESEELNEALLKVQSAMAILNGLQAVQATLLEESAAKSVLFANAQKLIALATGTATGAAKAFRIALLSTGIGALIVAIGLLVSNMDKLEEAVNPNITKARQLADASKKLAEASNLAVEAFDLEERRMKALGIATDDLYVKKRNLLVQDQKAKEQAAKDAEAFLKAVESDMGTIWGGVLISSGSSPEEIQAAREQAQAAIQVAEEAAVAVLELDAEMIEQTNRRNEEERQAEEERLKNEKEAANERKEQRKRIHEQEKQQIQTFNQSILELFKQADDAYLNTLGGADRIAAETAAADERISILQDSLSRELDTLNLSADQKAQKQAEIDQAINDLRAANVQDGEKKLRDLRIQEAEKNLQLDEQIALNEIKVRLASTRQQYATQEDYEKALQVQLTEAQIGFAQQRLAQISEQTGKEAEAAKSEIQATLVDLQQSLSELQASPAVAGPDNSVGGFVKKLFGLDDQGLSDLKEAASFAFDQFDQLFGQILAAQLAETDALLDSLDEQIAAQQEAVDEQSRLKEEGLANDLDSEKAALQRLNDERRKAAEEQAKIRKTQAVIEVAQQLGALGVAAAQMFASQAPKGLIGVGLAAGAIATILGFMQKLKASAGNSVIRARYGKAGMLSGGSHDFTGADGTRGVPFGSIEAEGGEAYGIIRKDAPKAHKQAFIDIANEINKGSLVSTMRPAYLPMSGSISSMIRARREMQSKAEQENQEIKRELRETKEILSALLMEYRNSPKFYQTTPGSVVERSGKVTRYVSKKRGKK